MATAQPQRDVRNGRIRGLSPRPRDGKILKGGRRDNRKTNATTSIPHKPSKPFKALPKPNGIRNNPRRNEGGTSSLPARKHRNSVSRSASPPSSDAGTERWRNPAEESSETYQKRMSDLYQMVCVHSSDY